MRSWSSDVCASELARVGEREAVAGAARDLFVIGVQEQRVEVVGAPRAQARGGVDLDFRLPVGVCTDHRGRIREPGGINPVSSHGRSHKSPRSEEHTSELQSLMRISYAVFCLKKNRTHIHNN